MKSTFFDFMKRDLILVIAVSALVFGGALAWGGPFLTTNSQATASTPAQTIAQTDIQHAR